MDVSENSGTTKSSILIRFSIINHPFWGTPIFGNTQICNPQKFKGWRAWLSEDILFQASMFFHLIMFRLGSLAEVEGRLDREMVVSPAVSIFSLADFFNESGTLLEVKSEPLLKFEGISRKFEPVNFTSNLVKKNFG